MSSRPRLSGRPSTAEHQAAVTRRLELLRAELVVAPVGDQPGDVSTVLGARRQARVIEEQARTSAAGGGGTEQGADPWWAEGARARPSAPHPVGPSAPLVSPDPVGASGGGSVALPQVSGPTGLGGALPVPGRHASRRGRVQPGLGAARWTERLELGERFAVGPAQLTVIAVVVALGLAITTWMVVRSSPDPVAVSASSGPGSQIRSTGQSTDSSTGTGDLVDLSPGIETVASPGVAAAPTESGPLGGEVAGGVGGSTTGSAGASVTVDVAGKVREPGIAVLPPGARVVDAIEAAGGARAGVDLTSLNLARALVDGEQVLVGVDAEQGAPPVGASSAPGSELAGGAAAGPSALVDLNTATEAQLDTLPDIGPVTAASIVAWRTEHGGFSAVDELLEVDGIGDATLARLTPFVTV